MKRILLFVLLHVSLISQGQILTDSSLRRTILNALDHLYNFEFSEADPYIRQLQTRYPQHPVGFVLKAAELQWQYFPLKDNPAATAQFVDAATKALDLCEKRLDQNDNDAEAIFFALTAHGYLALKFNNEHEQMKAVGESRRAYRYMKDGFKLMDKNPEFYFTTGLYNYYVERYPMEHPIVKPLMVFFQNGDMALGIRQLETATKRGLFTQAEASYYLAHIFLKYETQPGHALTYLRPLTTRYAKNPLYCMLNTEALLLAGQYDEARPSLQYLRKMPYKWLNVATDTFNGLLAEKVNHNDSEAAGYYQNALKQPVVENYTKEYHAFANAGLARIAARAGNRAQAKAYYKQATDIGEYKSIHQEAKAFK